MVVHLSSLTGVLFELHQASCCRQRLLVAILQAVGTHQKMYVMAVMPQTIERIGPNISQFALRRCLKRMGRFLPLSGLNIDVPWHVERVGNVWRQFRVAPAPRPRVPGKGGTLEAVNHVMVDARMVRDFYH